MLIKLSFLTIKRLKTKYSIDVDLPSMLILLTACRLPTTNFSCLSLCVILTSARGECRRSLNSVVDKFMRLRNTNITRDKINMI